MSTHPLTARISEYRNPQYGTFTGDMVYHRLRFAGLTVDEARCMSEDQLRNLRPRPISGSKLIRMLREDPDRQRRYRQRRKRRMYVAIDNPDAMAHRVPGSFEMGKRR